MTVYGGAATRLLYRFPAIGTVVGAAMFLGFGWLTWSSVRQTMTFPKQPRPSTIADAIPRAGDTNWVTLTDARWSCDRAFTSKNDDGSPRYTYVPATDGARNALVLICVEGAPDCAGLAAKPVTGVLHHMNPLLRGSLEDEGADFSGLDTEHAYALTTYLNPSNSKLGIWIGGAFALVGAFVTAFYGSRLISSR
jgi:hypothetical protein